MDHNGGYVWAAYTIAGGTLAAYAAWLVARLRSVSRSERREEP